MLSMILRSSTSNLNSLGWSASALLSSLVAKSMRPVGTQSRFTTPLNSLLVLAFARLAISASGFAIARSLTSIQDRKEFRSTRLDHYLAPVQNFLASDVVADFIVACVVAHCSGRLSCSFAQLQTNPWSRAVIQQSCGKLTNR